MTPRSDQTLEPVHFIPYGSYFAPCGYIADQRFPGRRTEHRRETTCGDCQAHMKNLGDLPATAPQAAEWECDEQGTWKPCYAPGCTRKRRRTDGKGEA